VFTVAGTCCGPDFIAASPRVSRARQHSSVILGRCCWPRAQKAGGDKPASSSRRSVAAPRDRECTTPARRDTPAITELNALETSSLTRSNQADTARGGPGSLVGEALTCRERSPSSASIAGRTGRADTALPRQDYRWVNDQGVSCTRTSRPGPRATRGHAHARRSRSPGQERARDDPAQIARSTTRAESGTA